MIETIWNGVLYISLSLHVVLMAVCAWRVWRGENVIDRLIGLDLMSTLSLAILVLISLILQRAIYLDVALGLAALGFIGTIALARYVSEEQMF